MVIQSLFPDCWLMNISTAITYLTYHFIDTAVLGGDYSILGSTISFNMTSASITDIEECVEAFMVLVDDDLFEGSENITVMIVNATAVRGSEMYNLNVSSSALEFTIVDPQGKHRMNPMNVMCIIKYSYLATSERRLSLKNEPIVLSGSRQSSVSCLVTGTLASFESQS